VALKQKPPLSKPVFYLIDGSSYIYRAYFALPFLCNSKGIPTHATYGFTRMLMKIVREHKPDLMAVAFDVGKATFRTEAYQEYKAQRPSMPQDLAVQLPFVKKIIQALKIPIIEMQNYEADDIIASLAKKASEADILVVIVGGDKDMLQLVKDSIKVFDPLKEIFYTPKEVEKKFGVSPERIPDLLGLAGDAIDNIPGVKGIGLKGAKELLSSYCSIEDVYAHLDKIPAKYQRRLKGKREIAVLSRDLVKVKNDLPIKINWDDLRVKEPDYERLRELFRELDFNTLLKELPPEKEQGVKYGLVTSLSQLQSLMHPTSNIKELSIDFETDSLSSVAAQIVGVALSFKEKEAYYIPVAHMDKKILPEDKVLKTLSYALSNPEIEKIGQNIKYELVILLKRGINVKGPLFDTMIASYLLNPSKRSHGLDELAIEYLGHRTTTYKEVVKKGKKEIAFSEVDLETACNYACEDAEITLRLKHTLEKQLKEEGLDVLFRDLESGDALSSSVGENGT